MARIIFIILAFSHTFALAEDPLKTVSFDELVESFYEKSHVPLDVPSLLHCYPPISEGHIKKLSKENFEKSDYPKFYWEEITKSSGYLNGENVGTGLYRSEDIPWVVAFVRTPYALEGVGKLGRVRLKQYHDEHGKGFLLAWSPNKHEQISEISLCEIYYSL